MKKIIFFLSLLCIGFTASSQKISDKTMSQMVDDMCGCIMPHINKLHPRLVKMFETMAAKGEEAAGKEFGEWYKTASETDTKRIEKDLEYMDGQFQADMDTCDQKLVEKYSEEAAKELSNLENKKIIKLIEEKEACKLVAIMLKMAEKEGKKDD